MCMTVGDAGRGLWDREEGVGGGFRGLWNREQGMGRGYTVGYTQCVSELLNRG